MERAIVSEAGVIVATAARDGGRSYLVIRREADWTLPKGHWESGEELVGTATRELAEEAGVTCRVTGPAGVFTYETGSEHRVVQYFHAEYQGPSMPPSGLDGVVQTQWLSRLQTAERLTYSDLRDFFLSVTLGGPQQGVLPTSRAILRNPRLDRLLTSIDVFSAELPYTRSNSLIAAGTAAAWRTAIDELVESARVFAHARRIDAGWEALQAAIRLNLNELTPDQVESAVISRRFEVGAKLQGWRRRSAEELLSRKEEEQPISSARLIEASRLLDEQSSNMYLKLRLGRAALPIAAVLLSVILGLLAVAVLLDAFDLAGRQTFVLTDFGLFCGAAVLGAFGAMLSLALDRDNSSLISRRIYEVAVAHYAVPVARLAIGASSGVLVVAATQSTLAGSGQEWAILTAIPAGFSERLVRRSVEALDAEAGGTPRVPGG